MEEVIAGLERLTFTLEEDVEMQKGTGILPFQGMNKSCSAVCDFFPKGLCEKGKLCPFRHTRGGKTVVCKHWLRGLCKKSDQCKFLHQYDVTRMPECYFYSKFGDCSNKDCSFLHTKAAFKTQSCPRYDQGFCKDGPLCKYRHVHRTMCSNYFVGFCPEGPECQYAHPKMILLFNPSDMKVSAGRKGPTCLPPLTACISWGARSPDPALAQLPSLAHHQLSVPVLGKAQPCGGCSLTPSNLYKLC
ncbi:putative cleavage and polyadenylation specificity factor subunit 4-like protein [Saccopteryx bilineata]|uniref:putative cleavage and polyadenylation specificity factor subunit 4-like protein n=1 Tax=Saccopteryx bilineata TaxID=59482 RepID=UPI00338F65F2